MIGFLLHIPLASKYLSLLSGNLFPQRCNLALAVVVGSALFVQFESGIVALFLQALKLNGIRIMTSFEIIVLQHLLILQVSILGLYCVKLVS